MEHIIMVLFYMPFYDQYPMWFMTFMQIIYMQVSNYRNFGNTQSFECRVVGPYGLLFL